MLPTCTASQTCMFHLLQITVCLVCVMDSSSHTCRSPASSNSAAPAPAGPGLPLEAPSNSYNHSTVCSQDCWHCRPCDSDHSAGFANNKVNVVERVPDDTLCRDSSMVERPMCLSGSERQPGHAVRQQHLVGRHSCRKLRSLHLVLLIAQRRCWD